MRKVLSIILVAILVVSSIPIDVKGQSIPKDTEKPADILEGSQETNNQNVGEEEGNIVEAEVPAEKNTTENNDTNDESAEELISDNVTKQSEDTESLNQEKTNNVEAENENKTEDTASETEAVKKSKESTEKEDTEVETEELRVSEPESTDTTDSEAKVNEFGIKEGTMVYGMDISKLTEEELQYIPKDWRDGIEEKEAESSEEPKFYSKSAYPDVNDWILKNTPSTANVKYEYKNFFAQFNYRYGYGKVEGVVAHETANPHSTIRSEIDFMSRNHNNAFVHAFVDHGNIIEIHPTNRAAWGAGFFANQRFVHVELVEEDRFVDFAKSINNYSDYLASVLYKYNLGVTDAERNGTGTLWSHNAVSKFLGGTNHTDPISYFGRWGYSWDEFVELVKLKYAAKSIKESSTSKLGHIRSSQSKIYTDLATLQPSKKAGSTYTNQVYYIKKEAKRNGQLYYLLSTKPSSTSGTIGWIRASDIVVYNHKSIDKSKKDYIINGNGKAYTKAWGGSKNFVYNLSSYKGSTLHVNLSEAVGSNLWLRGTLNGKQVWVHSSYVSAKGKTSYTSKLGHLKSNAKIYKDPLKPSTVRIAGNKDLNQVYYIKKQIDSNGEKYYLISYSPSSTKGTLGWVKSTDMSVHEHKGVSKAPKTLYVKGTGTAYSKAWGGSKNKIYTLSSLKGEKFEVNLTEKVGSNTWYRGKLNGKNVFIHSAFVTTSMEVKTSQLGHLGNNARIYTNLSNPSSYKVAEKDGFTNAVYYAKRQAKLNGELYYKISTKPSSTAGVVGWVKASDFNHRSHKSISNNRKTMYVKGTGEAFTKAWGGSKNKVYNLSSLKGEKFEVNLTEKVGNNTWYRGMLNGKNVFIHSAFVSDTIESTTSMLGHLGNNTRIYTNLSNLSSYKIARREGFTNAVYYAKRQAKLNGEMYYKISTKPSSISGVVGWVKASEFNHRTHKSISKNRKTLYVKGTGEAFTKAWGGSKNKVYSLSSLKGEKFEVNLTEKVGTNTWYRGILHGKNVFIHSSYVR
ncbi:peptidoglycan recognition protein family protein [Terribacillus halophilus]|jgi:internalin B|uniref:peptidoglycan recognition protein family protein n=1 Tax=Terribacillus halophilus TaxID=361279 RepID=UPI0009872371|nr:GW dipeptide domain-containing protein [Terribacillus halophilus]